jgi:hypothetical protein
MACGCPDGYTPSPDNEECVRITSVPATINPTNYLGTGPKTDPSYGSLGTNFYEDVTGRPLPISGITTPLSLRDATLTLVNITNISTTGVWGNSGGSRLNYCGIWTNAGSFGLDPPFNEWIGFSKCINVPETGVYCIGIAGDNRVRFRVNGVLTVQINFNTPNTWAFNRWHVIPITLQSGINIIELEGYNDNSVASFGAEIYQATVPELLAMTTFAEVTAVTIFTTRDQIGQPFNIGEESGYSCPDGYALNLCGEAPVCSIIERTAYTPCAYPLTNCETLSMFLVNTDLSAQVGKTVTLENIEGCWTVGTLVPEISITEVVVLEEFDVCNECVEKCYLLVECNNLLPPIKTNVDLSAQVGLYIKISSCPKNCWLVQEAFDCEGTIVVVDPTFSFQTCEECNPPEIITTPELIHSRKVKPGYNTKSCSPEYFDRINCAFADQVFNQIVKKRFGITPCCEDEFDKYLLKKELLDLQILYDPNICKSTCYTCKAPCGIETVLTVYSPILCLPPQNVVSVLDIISSPCEAPEDVESSSVIIFNVRHQ